MTLATAQISVFSSLAFEHRADLPAIPAVYFVLNEHRNVMYVGTTENLRMRWKAHHRALWNRTEIPADDMKQVIDHITRVARYMDVSPKELTCKILMDWAYNRPLGNGRDA